MPREVKARTAEDWQTEAQRITRIASAAKLDPRRGAAWRKAVERLSNSLVMLIGITDDRAALKAAETEASSAFPKPTNPDLY